MNKREFWVVLGKVKRCAQLLVRLSKLLRPIVTVVHILRAQPHMMQESIVFAAERTLLLIVMPHKYSEMLSIQKSGTIYGTGLKYLYENYSFYFFLFCGTIFIESK